MLVNNEMFSNERSHEKQYGPENQILYKVCVEYRWFFPIFDDTVDGYSIFPLGRKWGFGLVKKKVESILIQFSNKIHVYQVTRVQMKNNAHY